MRAFFVSLASLIVIACAYDVKLTERSTLFLPYTYDNDGQGVIGLEKGSAEQLAFDDVNKIVYVVGGGILHAVDVSDYNNVTVLAYISFPDAEFNDVEFCGGHLFVAMDNKTVKTEGEVFIFSAYNSTIKTMALIERIKVGFVPDMLKPTSDCSKLVVCVEAEAYIDGADIIDPPGLVVILSFPGGVITDYNKVTLDFQEYNNKAESLRPSGVRHVYQENNNPFSNDVEPEYVTFNHDYTVAYICLQENNAVAVVDMIEQKITNIIGLGFKDWSKSSLDPSDKDTGALMYPYNVLGMYQPDTIRHFRLKGESYILMANEGDAKAYDGASEEVRGRDIDPDILPDLDEQTKFQLGRKSLLGRLKFSVSPSGKNSTGHLRALYTFGGRGFSIRRADDMSLVYDSGDDVSRRTLALKKELYNAFIDDEDMLPFENRELRSDDKGPETESLAVGEVQGRTLLFIGNERPGTIMVYSLQSDVSKPEFHYIFDGIPDKRFRTWKQQFDDRELSSIDCEDLKFIPAEKSSNGKPVLLVAGSVSGTLSILDVEVTVKAPTTTDPNTAVSTTSLSIGMVAAMVIVSLTL